MLFFDGIVGLALLGLWLFCVIDVIMTEEAACRTTPHIEYDRPGSLVASRPEDDEEFLRRCRERAEEQRRLYREQQKKDEQD